MTPDEAIERLVREFPFPDYVNPASGAHRSVAEVTLKYLPDGGNILDVGAGPCDKTAVLQILGYKCTACDDLSDNWHLQFDNRARIQEFASRLGIDLRVGGAEALALEADSFDMAMLHDVLEHLHSSPRELLNRLLTFLKPNGLLFVTVPNAVNIRKRLDVMRGCTNLPPFDTFFWYPGEWRGHIREYTKDDLQKLAANLGVETIELRSCHQMLGRLPRYLVPFYRAITVLFPGWRDSWLLVARKPPGWMPAVNAPSAVAAAALTAPSG